MGPPALQTAGTIAEGRIVMVGAADVKAAEIEIYACDSDSGKKPCDE
jgi:hypothetical protein